MACAAVGEVVESRSAQYAVGDTVRGMLGWAEYGVSKAEGIGKVDARQIPLSAYLGVVGMPGMTAWYGYNKIMEPKPGETVVVSAAAGAVGSVVGQLARLGGVRVIGIAGGPDKCRYVTGELGFDACIDYKTAADAKSLAAMIAAAVRATASSSRSTSIFMRRAPIRASPSATSQSRLILSRRYLRQWPKHGVSRVFQTVNYASAQSIRRHAERRKIALRFASHLFDAHFFNRARHREHLLRDFGGAGRQARERPRNLRPFDRGRSVGPHRRRGRP